MATTVQIQDSTKQLLMVIKEKKEMPTYDAVIRELIEEKISIPKSLLGYTKGKLKKVEHVGFHEL